MSRQTALTNWTVPLPAEKRFESKVSPVIANEWEQRSRRSMEEAKPLHTGMKRPPILPTFESSRTKQFSSSDFRKSNFSKRSRLGNGADDEDNDNDNDNGSDNAFEDDHEGADNDTENNDNDGEDTVTESTIDFDAEYSFSQSQLRALEAIMRRQSVFFTGAAGTGKSYILKILDDIMTAVGMANKISFTAPTGVAACNIRGTTLHSWAGIGQGSEDTEQLIGAVLRNRNACQRWRETEILVIDEISMLSAELFDKLDLIGRRVRNKLTLFGGLQLVMCGDFFQLPPVGMGKATSFCFESKAWAELFADKPENLIVLETVYRQRDDQVFLKLLNDLRVGYVSPAANQLLMNKVRECQAAEAAAAAAEAEGAGLMSSLSRHAVAVRPTKLFSTNKDVDEYNLAEFQRLMDAWPSKEGEKRRSEHEQFNFQAVDDGLAAYQQQLNAGTKAPKLLQLRVGAQVMLVKNLSTGEGLINGARGTVLGFEPSNGRSGYFPRLPVVKFEVIVGSERREIIHVLKHELWEIKQGARVLASRTQIPLVLAWAISIHKSQGMTIPFLEVSFNRMFEYGQGYVALSRATCLQGLTLRSFSAASVRAHPKVKAYYQLMQRQKQARNEEKSLGGDETVQVRIQELVDVFQGEEAQQTVRKRRNVDNDEWIETRKALPRHGLPPTRPTRVGRPAYDDWLEEEQPPISPSQAYSQKTRRPAALAERKTAPVEEPASKIAASPPSRTADNFVDLTIPAAPTPPIPAPERGGSEGRTAAQLHASFVRASEMVRVGSSNVGKSAEAKETVVITEDMKRRMEENRKLALQRLEQFK